MSFFNQETSRRSLFREYQPPVRDSVTSFYSFQLLFVLLATSVLSWPRDPSTREGYSQAAPPGHSSWGRRRRNTGHRRIQQREFLSSGAVLGEPIVDGSFASRSKTVAPHHHGHTCRVVWEALLVPGGTGNHAQVTHVQPLGRPCLRANDSSGKGLCSVAALSPCPW